MPPPAARLSPRGLPYTIALIVTVIFAAISILRAVFRAPSAGGDSSWSSRSPPFERTSEGLEGERGAADWPVLRTAVTTRLALHGASVSVVDGRTGAGTGSRVLLVYARRAADADAAGGGVGGARVETRDTLLFTVREADGRDVLAARTGFLGAGAARPSPPASRPRGGSPGGLFGLIRRLWSGNMLQHGGGVVGGGGGRGAPWPERHIPQGPARGKAARAFGASARGHALVSRQCRDGGPSLRVDLAVDFPRISCCDTSAESAQSDAALIDAAPELAGKWPFVCADGRADACTTVGTLGRLSSRGFLQSITAARALASAADASPRSARVISGAPLTAGELSWAEALTAALADAVRLNLALLYTPAGALISWNISTASAVTPVTAVDSPDSASAAPTQIGSGDAGADSSVTESSTASASAAADVEPAPTRDPLIDDALSPSTDL